MIVTIVIIVFAGFIYFIGGGFTGSYVADSLDVDFWDEPAPFFSSVVWPITLAILVGVTLSKSLRSHLTRKRKPVEPVVMWPDEIVSSSDYRKLLGLIQKYEQSNRIPIHERGA